MSLSNTIRLSLLSILSGSEGLANVSGQVQESLSATLATAGSVADGVYGNTTTLAGSASAALDVTALTDAIGDALELDKVQMLYIQNTGAGDLTIGGTDDLSFLPSSAALVIPSGGTFFWFDDTGTDVGTDDKITLTADATGTTAKVVVIGIKA